MSHSPELKLNLLSQPLGQALDEAADALATFDGERLDAIEQRVGKVTAEDLARSVAKQEWLLSELLLKHSMLGQLLQLTAANLKVLVSVRNLTTGEVLRSER
jgi:hypothetical protein